MTRTVEWVAAVLAAAAFGAIWVVGVVASETAVFDHPTALLVWWSFTVVPAVFAAWVLIRRVRPIGDGPERLFGLAAALMPAHRGDWVLAMRAELAHVPGNAGRWAFAAGCVRAALAPGAGWAPVAAAALAGVTAAYALPAITVFAVTFVGVLVLVLPAPARRLPTVTGVAGLLGVVACVVTVTYLVAEYPSMGTALVPGSAVVLGVLLAGSARLALAPPRVLMGYRAARVVAVGTVVAAGAGFVLGSRLPADAGGMWYAVLGPPVVLSVVGAVVAAAHRSFRAGLLAVVWATMLCTTWIFALWLTESVHWHQNGMGAVLDADNAGAIGVNLKDGIVWVATWLPVWGLPIGVLGAAAGARILRSR